MTDRQPGAPGQYILTVDASVAQNLLTGLPVTVTLVRDDQPVVEGTPYNKASVLPDDLAALICPEVINPTPADAFRGLKSIIDGGLSTTLLWENASPDSDFAAQSIKLDLADYSHILVDFVSTEASLLIRKGSYTAASRINVTSTASNAVVIEMMRRLISFSDTSVTVHAGSRSMYTITSNKFTSAEESSTFAKPFRIYGVKGVL